MIEGNRVATVWLIFAFFLAAGELWGQQWDGGVDRGLVESRLELVAGDEELAEGEKEALTKSYEEALELEKGESRLPDFQL
ncbi:MAG: hypothetical protein AAF591_18875 [Verrucomicrobiota bacterium]